MFLFKERLVGDFRLEVEFKGAAFFVGLRVVHGIDVWEPRFNIVSPGVATEIYFPAGDDARRRAGGIYQYRSGGRRKRPRRGFG